MIPSSIDATFLPNDDSNSNPLQVKNEGFSVDGGRSPTKLTYLIINDKTANAALRKMCQDCTDDFSKRLNDVDDYLNYIERMKAVLKKTSIWTPDLEGKIGAVAAFLKTIPDGMKEVVIQYLCKEIWKDPPRFSTSLAFLPNLAFFISPLRCTCTSGRFC